MRSDNSRARTRINSPAANFSMLNLPLSRAPRRRRLGVVDRPCWQVSAMFLRGIILAFDFEIGISKMEMQVKVCWVSFFIDLFFVSEVGEAEGDGVIFVILFNFFVDGD